MKATTKLTLALGIASLSAVVACTVTTSTNGNGNDNGTVVVPLPEDSGSSVLVCPPAEQLTTIGGDQHPNCQACLNTNCCEELHQCYDVVGTDSGANSNCETYSQCIDGCNDLTDAESQKACFDACDSSAAPGVLAGYNAINTCAANHCAAPTCLVGTAH